MTQSPRSGQAAPLDTTADPSTAPRYEMPPRNVNNPWSAPPGSSSVSSGTGASAASGVPAGASTAGQSSTAPPFVSAESRTGTLPAVKDPVKDSPPPPSSDTRGASRAARARGPRRARLQLRHINPWTVLKFSCVLAIALFFVWLILVGVLFGVLDAAGVIGKINDGYTTLKGGGAKAPVTATIVFGVSAIIGVVNIILFIALSTIGSVIYNLCADLVGGIEVTLSER